MDGIYSTVIIKDVLERAKLTGFPGLNNPVLLRKIVTFLAENIGSSVSFQNISKGVNRSGFMVSETDKDPAVSTVSLYMSSLLESFIFYEINRFDIRSNEHLKTLGKYYIVDTGLRNYILGLRGGDQGHLLENVVYFELLRKGYSVSVGKIDDNEVDFIATKSTKKCLFKLFIQYLMIKQFKEKQSHYLKYLITIQN